MKYADLARKLGEPDGKTVLLIGLFDVLNERLWICSVVMDSHAVNL